MNVVDRTYTMTDAELRRIVFETSCAYAGAIKSGLSTQEAEWVRSARLKEILQREGV